MAKKKKPQDGPPERRIPTVSSSQLDSWNCRLRWYWSYRRGYRTDRIIEALTLGSGIHDALQAWYEHQIEPAKFFPAWCKLLRKGIDEGNPDHEILDRIEHLGTGMLGAYREHWANELVDEFEIVATEHTVRVPIPIPDSPDQVAKGVYVGRLDGIVRDLRSGELWGLEHKSFSRLDPKAIEMNGQFTGQVWLGRHLKETLGLKEELVGVIYNGLRKQDPATAKKPETLFHRQRLFRGERQVQVYQHRVFCQFREITMPGVDIYPTPMQECSWCDYRDVCIAYQKGNDYQFMLDSGFESREQRTEKGDGSSRAAETRRFEALVKRLTPKPKKNKPKSKKSKPKKKAAPKRKRA